MRKIIFFLIFFIFSNKIIYWQSLENYEKINNINKYIFKNYEISKIKNIKNFLDSKYFLEKYKNNEKALYFQEQFNKKFEENLGKKNKLICIDPWHQEKADMRLEEIWPGSKLKKPKITDWAVWIFTKQKESEFNLDIAKKIEKLAKNENFDIYLTRNSQKVNISNKERSLAINKLNCDVYVRIHADSSKNKNIHWTSVLTSSKNNIFVKDLYQKNYNLSKKGFGKFTKRVKI